MRQIINRTWFYGKKKSNAIILDCTYWILASTYWVDTQKWIDTCIWTD
jgi:hypothetical protein